MIESLEAFRAARLKRETVTIPDTEIQVEVQELATAGWTALLQAQAADPEDNPGHAMVIIQHGVPAFAGQSLADIKAAVTVSDAVFLAGEIMRLTGVGDDDPAKK